MCLHIQKQKQEKNMKTAVVFYSLGGNTAFAAERIASRIQADLIEVRTENAYPQKGIAKYFWAGKSSVMAEKPALQRYDFCGESYDQIIIGFPVWAGNFAPPIRTFLNENRDQLTGKRICVFACESGAGAERAFKSLKEFLQIESFANELILVDPKDKPEDINGKKIEAFCEACLMQDNREK